MRRISPLLVLTLTVAALPAQAASIHTAARKGDLAQVRTLLAQGTEIDARAKNGSTPLMVAARHGRDEIVYLLLKEGADVNLQDNTGSTALHEAIAYGQVSAVRALLSAGASLEERTTRAGWTPLMTAAANGNAHFVEVLLLAGANPNATDFEGNTTLQLALTYNGTPEVVERLNAAMRPPPTKSDTNTGTESTTPTEQRVNDRFTFRNKCPSDLEAMFYVSGRLFFVDVSLPAVDALLDPNEFRWLCAQAIVEVDSRCSNASMINQIEVVITTPEYPNRENPAAAMQYRRGAAAAFSGAQGAITYRNRAFTERFIPAFLKKNGVEAQIPVAEIIGNPFLFEGKVVALDLEFLSMETPDTGRFSGGGGEVAVIGLPKDQFRLPHQGAFIAVKVLGKTALPGSETRLPTLQYVDSYLCLDAKCSELR